jgi:hypothetical protein
MKQRSFQKLALRTTPIIAMMFLLSVFLLSVFLLFSPVDAQQPDSLTLSVPYEKGHIFEVPSSDLKVKIDLEGFEPTYDSQTEEKVLVIAGNPKRRMVVKVTADTLFSDLEKKPQEYRDLWWYFYTQDTTLDIGKLKVWNDESRNWSTHTIMTSYNVDINERHYDMFQIQGNHFFHVSIKRPLYLEGDSTLMLNILNSFEIITPNKAAKKKQ